MEIRQELRVEESRFDESIALTRPKLAAIWNVSENTMKKYLNPKKTEPAGWKGLAPLYTMAQVRVAYARKNKKLPEMVGRELPKGKSQFQFGTSALESGEE